jgi:hypothetical protein
MANGHRVVSFGRYTFPQTEQKYEDNFTEAITKFTQLPGGGVVDEYGRDNSPSGRGMVKLTYVITATTDANMQTARDLARSMRRVGVQPLIVQTLDGTSYRRCLARVKNISMPEDLSRFKIRRWHEVTITWETADAAWEMIVNGLGSWGDGSNWGSDSDWYAPSVISGLSTNYNISSIDGAGANSQPFIHCTCTGVQTASDITLIWYDQVPQSVELALSPHKIRWLGTLTAGDDLLIDCTAGKVLFCGADAYNDFEYRTPEWIETTPSGGRLVIQMANSGDAMNFNFLNPARYY